MAANRDRHAVFLDRDGVLNDVRLVRGQPHPPESAGELRLLAGVVDACQQLRSAGYLLIVVTNQPDIARAATTSALVDAINARLCEQVAIDAVYVCPHDDGDGCTCRKPACGLLLMAADEWHIDLHRSVMVGDRWKDIEAGRRAGCATVLVDARYAETRPVTADHVVDSLAAAVPWILTRFRVAAIKEA